MTPLEIPVLRSSAGNWRAVSIELGDVGGTRLAVVTVRDLVKATRRRWFGDERDALAWAAGQADNHNLPLIDLREGDDHV